MLSIVIPAYNEEKSILQTLELISETLRLEKINPSEIIVVDDGSSDNTALLAQAAGAIVVKHPHNIGYGGALKTGILKAKYNAILITDSDGTYPINRIQDLYKKYVEGFDMVVGARVGKNYRGSAIKWPMRIALRFLVEWTAGRKIPDINSGMRIFDKTKIISYFPRLCNTFSFTTSATLAYMMNGQFVTYVPIDYAERVGETHVRLWKDSLRTFQFILQAVTYYNPLKIFLLLSFCLFSLGIFSIIVGLIFKIATAFVMAVAAFFGCILIFALGLLADLLRQILGK